MKLQISHSATSHSNIRCRKDDFILYYDLTMAQNTLQNAWNYQLLVICHFVALTCVPIRNGWQNCDKCRRKPDNMAISQQNNATSNTASCRYNIAAATDPWIFIPVQVPLNIKPSPLPVIFVYTFWNNPFCLRGQHVIKVKDFLK